MSTDPTDDTSSNPIWPSLKKDEPVVPPAPQPSIWQPLDGSAPRHETPEPVYRPAPGTGAWGAPHRPGADRGDVPTPEPHEVAAAYAAHANANPQGPAANVFTLSGWWRRAGAYLIDSLVFGLGIVVILIAAGLAAGMTLEEASVFISTGTTPETVIHPEWLYAVLVVGRVMIGVLPAIFLVRWNGQTPGKRALGLRVMSAGGEAMTFRVALRREVLGRVILFQLVSIFTLGLGVLVYYLWPVWDPQRRAGHDFVANTRVVTAPAPVDD